MVPQRVYSLTSGDPWWTFTSTKLSLLTSTCNMKSINCSCLQIWCLQGFKKSTSHDPRWPLIYVKTIKYSYSQYDQYICTPNISQQGNISLSLSWTKKTVCLLKLSKSPSAYLCIKTVNFPLVANLSFQLLKFPGKGPSNFLLPWSLSKCVHDFFPMLQHSFIYQSS